MQWETRRIYFLQWFSSSVFCGPSWIMTLDHWNGMPAVYSGSLNGIMACLLSVIGSRYRTNNTITDTSTPYERHGVSNWRQLDCSFSYLFATRAKNTITPHHWPIVREMFRLSSTKVNKVKAEWPWKYRSRSKVITCDTPSDGNDDLCQIWKECKQNCRFFFKVKAKKLEKFAKNWNFLFLFCKHNTRHTL